MGTRQSSVKVVVWRYGLPLQTGMESTVGGGLLTSAVLRALPQNATLVGKRAKGATVTLPCKPTLDIQDADVAIILTGPGNGLYGEYAATYQRLSTMKPGSKVAYLQWDVALPFHFNPTAPQPLPPLPSGVRWFVLSQCDGKWERSRRAKAAGYSTAKFEHIPCFFEQAQLAVPHRSVVASPFPRLAYLGSDRPGRMRELARYLRTGVEADVYGRWSDKSLREAQTWGRVRYCGTVPEALVPELLGRYAATLYVADPIYIRSDFVAQRFFENGTAGVPVAYSTRLQPSVERVVPQFVVEPERLCQWLKEQCALSASEREQAVAAHRSAIGSLQKPGFLTIGEAIQRVIEA